MNKRRKRKKSKIESRIPQNQTYVENHAPATMQLFYDQGIPLQREKHSLSDEEDFLNIQIIAFKDQPVDPLGGTHKDHAARSLREKVKHVIEDWGCDWEAIEAHYADLNAKNEFLAWDYKCAEIYNNFSYKKMGLISLYEAPYINEKGKKEQGFFIQDGIHRSLSLACLLLQEKTEWQPIPFWHLSLPENVKVIFKS